MTGMPANASISEYASISASIYGAYSDLHLFLSFFIVLVLHVRRCFYRMSGLHRVQSDLIISILCILCRLVLTQLDVADKPSSWHDVSDWDHASSVLLVCFALMSLAQQTGLKKAFHLFSEQAVEAKVGQVLHLEKEHKEATGPGSPEPAEPPKFSEEQPLQEKDKEQLPKSITSIGKQSGRRQLPKSMQR